MTSQCCLHKWCVQILVHCKGLEAVENNPESTTAHLTTHVQLQRVEPQNLSIFIGGSLLVYYPKSVWQLHCNYSLLALWKPPSWLITGYGLLTNRLSQGMQGWVGMRWVLELARSICGVTWWPYQLVLDTSVSKGSPTVVLLVPGSCMGWISISTLKGHHSGFFERLFRAVLQIDHKMRAP